MKTTNGRKAFYCAKASALPYIFNQNKSLETYAKLRLQYCYEFVNNVAAKDFTNV